MPWPQCTIENYELKNLFLDILNNDYLTSTSSTITGAYIQSAATLAAGILACLAGFFAFLATKEHNNILKNEKTARQRAYKNHISIALQDLKDDIQAIIRWADTSVDSYPAEKALPKLALPIPDDIKNSNWESHALLPEANIKDLYKLYRATLAFQKILNDIDEKKLKIDAGLPHALTIEKQGERHISHYSDIGAFLSNHPLRLIDSLNTVQKGLEKIKI